MRQAPGRQTMDLRSQPLGKARALGIPRLQRSAVAGEGTQMANQEYCLSLSPAMRLVHD